MQQPRNEKIKHDDPIGLIFYTTHGYIHAGNVSRLFAKSIIDEWYMVRERKRKDEPILKEDKMQDAGMLLENGTFSLMDVGAEGDTYPRFAVAWEHVIAIVAQEMTPSPQQIMAESMTKLVQGVQEHVKESQEGEEWKKGTKEEEGDEILPDEDDNV